MSEEVFEKVSRISRYIDVFALASNVFLVPSSGSMLDYNYLEEDANVLYIAIGMQSTFKI